MVWPTNLTGRLPDDVGVTTEHLTAKHELGTRYAISDRVFRYCHIKSNANVLRRGSVCVSYNTASIEKGAQLGAITNGTSIVPWTVVQRTVTKDQFKDGYLLMQGGFVKGVESNSPGAKGASINITLKEPITESSASSGRYGILCEGLYSNAMERTYGNTGPGLVIGVPLADYTEDYYAWLQTWGPCGVISTAATVNDTAQVTGIKAGVTTGDQIMSIATNAAMTQEERIIGYHIPYNTDNWDDEGYRMLFLTISP
jgi:hypothetical protein